MADIEFTNRQKPPRIYVGQIVYVKQKGCRNPIKHIVIESKLLRPYEGGSNEFSGVLYKFQNMNTGDVIEDFDFNLGVSIYDSEEVFYIWER